MGTRSFDEFRSSSGWRRELLSRCQLGEDDVKISCARCGRKTEKLTGEVNRARKAGGQMFCGRRCHVLSRLSGKTKAQKVAEKRLYDLTYRKENRAMLAEKKRAYFERTYDPVKAAKKRKKNAARHLAYIRQPRWKAWKSDYDKKRRETSLHARAGMPKWVPLSIVQSIDLLKTIRKVQREYKRA